MHVCLRRRIEMDAIEKKFCAHVRGEVSVITITNGAIKLFFKRDTTLTYIEAYLFKVNFNQRRFFFLFIHERLLK
jgi:hypothetical protein